MSQQQVATKAPTKQTVKIAKVEFEEKYVPQAIEMFVQSYQKTNPIYTSIKMTDQEIRDLIKDSFYDRKNYKNSFGYIDQITGRLLGCGFLQDVADFSRKEDRVFEANPKIALKQQIEYELVDQFFADLRSMNLKLEKKNENEELVSGNLKEGQIMYMLRGCIGLENQSLGLGSMLTAETMKHIGDLGFKYAYGVIHNRNMGLICEKLSGKLTKIMNLKDRQDSTGEYVFKDNDYGMANVIFDYTNEKNVQIINNFYQNMYNQRNKRQQKQLQQAQPRL